MNNKATSRPLRQERMQGKKLGDFDIVKAIWVKPPKSAQFEKAQIQISFGYVWLSIPKTNNS